MRILFTNDDGYDAIGLHSVADLFKGEHSIAVIAPKSQRSAFSHAVNTLTPFSYAQVSGYDYPVYAVDGSPVDCAKFGLMNIFTMPDIIVSGINVGRNLGSDVMYSGTVGAAFEGAYYGIRGIALSLNARKAEKADFDRCAAFFKKNFDRLVSLKLMPWSILNINFPSGEPRGVKVAPMSLSQGIGESYVADGQSYRYKGMRGQDPGNKSDESYCMQGYITITPLTMDQTDRASLKNIKKEKFVL